MPTIEEICYLAGIIDGEGWIGIGHRRDGTSATLGLRIRMTDKDLIAWLGSKFRGRIYLKGLLRPRRKMSYAVAWHGRDAKALLKLVLPYLHTKRRQAELVLEWPMPHLRGRNELPYWAQKKRDLIHQEMHKLNRKGVTVAKDHGVPVALCKEGPEVWRRLGLRGKCNCMS